MSAWPRPRSVLSVPICFGISRGGQDLDGSRRVPLVEDRSCGTAAAGPSKNRRETQFAAP